MLSLRGARTGRMTVLSTASWYSVITMLTQSAPVDRRCARDALELALPRVPVALGQYRPAVKVIPFIFQGAGSPPCAERAVADSSHSTTAWRNIL